MTIRTRTLTGDFEFDFPSYLAGSCDEHVSQADYVSLVEHEIDLYIEGEESDITNSTQLQYCTDYVKRYR